MSWNIQKPGDYINGPLTVTGEFTVKTNLFKVDTTNDRVGVGTASPATGTKLDIAGFVRGTSGAVFQGANNLTTGVGLELGYSTSSAYSFLQSFDRSGAAYKPIRLIGSSIDFDIANSVKATIDSSGNVGVGVTPSVRLDLLVADAAEGARFRAASGWLRAHPYLSATDGARLQSVNGTNTGLINLTLEGFNLRFNTNGGLAAILDSNLNLLTGGKTTATANGGDVQVSSGITFPATQVAKSDANTLDDYEEGIFTPAITGSTTAGTATYVGRTGKYTKIGNLVNVQIYIDYNSHTGVGDTRISGLPFTNSSAFAAATVGYANAITVSANYYLGAYVDAGNSWILLNQIPVAGGTNQTVPIDPAGTLVISAVYTV